LRTRSHLRRLVQLLPNYYRTTARIQFPCSDLSPAAAEHRMNPHLSFLILHPALFNPKRRSRRQIPSRCIHCTACNATCATPWLSHIRPRKQNARASSNIFSMDLLPTVFGTALENTSAVDAVIVPLGTPGGMFELFVAMQDLRRLYSENKDFRAMFYNILLFTVSSQLLKACSTFPCADFPQRTTARVITPFLFSNRWIVQVISWTG
jgi:hypothetical protein